MRNWRTRTALGALLSVFVLLTLAGLGPNLALEKPALKEEITNQAARVLAPGDNYSLVGIEQTLVARVTPAARGAEFEWTVGGPALRTYRHDVQRAGKHLPMPLGAKDRAGQHLSFF